MLSPRPAMFSTTLVFVVLVVDDDGVIVGGGAAEVGARAGQVNVDDPVGRR